MKSFSVRLGIVAGVFVVVAAGASALATPDLIKKDTSKCGSLQNHYCSSPTACEDSVYVSGLCRDDRDGSTSAISVQCCCCTDGANHRSFIGG